MKHRALLIAVVGLTLFGGSAPRNPAAGALHQATLSETETPQARPRVARHYGDPGLDPYGVYGADANVLRIIRSQEELFTVAGLDLPPLRIYVHGSTADCDGHLGVFGAGGDVNRVDICKPNAAIFRPEVAHSWERHDVTDEQRNAFMQFFEIDSWFDRKLDHEQRGAEKVALVLSWGIQKKQLSELTAVALSDFRQGYQILTGSRSLRITTGRSPEAPGSLHGDIIEIHGASPESRIQILRDIDLFESAGLELPALQIHVHDSVDGCDGWRGMFNADGSGHRIDLCGDVLLHELAHAWEYHFVDDATRQDFLEFANLDVWYDASVPHPSRGVEHAANTIAWGVGTSEDSIGQVRPHTNLAERYELLTGLVSRRVVGSVGGGPGDAAGASNVRCERMCD